jgi:hypothetical protein
MRVRFAAIAIVAVLLISGLPLVLAQPPDCTTKECNYLPIIEHNIVPTNTATFTAVPTDTPTLSPTMGSPRPPTPTRGRP